MKLISLLITFLLLPTFASAITLEEMQKAALDNRSLVKRKISVSQKAAITRRLILLTIPTPLMRQHQQSNGKILFSARR